MSVMTWGEFKKEVNKHIKDSEEIWYIDITYPVSTKEKTDYKKLNITNSERTKDGFIIDN